MTSPYLLRLAWMSLASFFLVHLALGLIVLPLTPFHVAPWLLPDHLLTHGAAYCEYSIWRTPGAQATPPTVVPVPTCPPVVTAAAADPDPVATDPACETPDAPVPDAPVPVAALDPVLALGPEADL